MKFNLVVACVLLAGLFLFGCVASATPTPLPTEAPTVPPLVTQSTPFPTATPTPAPTVLASVEPTATTDPVRNLEILPGTKAYAGKVTGEWVAYRSASDGELFHGYYAKPDVPFQTFPGIVMIHEWYGLNPTIKEMAVKLAEEGYQVMAVDLYDGKVATNAEEARALISAVDGSRAVANMRAATNYLRNSNAAKVASLGWCFGGGKSLALAVSGQPLDATVVYYGTPFPAPDELKKINWPVFGVFGDKDQAIPIDKVNQFKKDMSAAEVNYEEHVYPGLGHAFANPSGASWAPEQTKEAWELTLSFLAKNLK